MKAASPAFPAVPNSTPASARSRAPIHNPYDKFPQGEFDAWIGDITTVLKRALGQEPPPPPPPSAAKSASVQIIPASLAHFANGVDFDDSVAEDSFAEIKARKAAKAKGKQRAVSEEDEDEFEVEASILQGLDGESEEEEEGSGEESYHPNHQYQYGFDDHGEEYSDEDEEEEEEVEVQPFENNADDPIEILSSDEEDDPQERVSVHHNHDVYEEDEAGDEDSLLEQDEEDEDEDELNSNGFLPSSPQADDEPEPPIELPDVWSGPRQYAEDYYAGGDVQSFGDPSHLGEEDGYAGEEEEEEGDEEEQGEGEEEEEEEEEDFPPPQSDLPPVELPDKWAGPRSYAEDFYAGGDRPQEYYSSHTPSHLTPRLGSPREARLGSPQAGPSSLKGKEPEVIELVDDDDEEEEEAEEHEDREGEEPPVFSMPTEDTSSQHFPEDEADEEDDTHTPTHLHPAEFIPQTHDRSSSPLPTEVQVSPSGHVDWNWPPAFKGRAVSASPGKSPSKSPGARMVAVEEVVEISDDDDEKDQDEDELDVPQHESVADAEDEDDSPEVAGAPSDDFNDVFTIANSNSTSTSNPESFEIDTFLQTHPDALEPDVEAMYPPDGNEAEILDIANHEPYEGGVGASEEGEGFEPLRTPSVGFGDLPDDGDDQAQAQAVGGRPEEGVGEGVEGMGIDVPDFLEKLVQLASSGAFSAPPNASLTAVSDSNSLAGPSNIPQDQELSAEALEALEQQFVGEQTPDPSYELGYEYTVSEPSEPGDRARSQRGMSLDVTSVTGEVGYVDVEVEVGVEVEVEVEEVGTEGRRSEEPGLVVEVLDEEFESVVVEEEEKTKLDEGLSDSKEKELNGIQAADIEAGESLSVRTKPDVEVETPVVVEDQQPVNTDDFVEAREAQISKAQPAPIVQSDEGVEESSQVFEPAKPDDTTETGKAETSSQAAPIVQIRMDDVVEGSSQLVEPVKVDDAMETVEAEAETPSEEKSVSIVQVNEGIEEVPQSVEPVVVDDTIAAEPTTSPQSPLVERISSPEVMLQPGIPMPVSADPDVPDPASIHVSPIDSPKPATPEEDEESDRDEANVNPNSNTTVASAIPPNLLRHISGHRTVSGLFTPMSEGSSYPPSPTMQDVIDEQPTEETPLETPVESSSPVPEGASSADVAPSPQAEQPEPASSKSEDDVSAALEHVQDQPEVPASTSPPQVDESQGSAPLTPQGDDADDADLDEDADGDVDPDYEAPEEVVTVDVSSPTPEASGERTPRGVSVAPEVQVNGDVPSGGDDENEPRHQSDLPLDSEKSEKDAQPEPTTLEPDAPVDTSAPVSKPTPKIEDEEQEQIPPRSQKRKRSSPAPVIRVTRSRSTKVEEEVTQVVQSEKSKGKQKALIQDPEPPSSPPSEHSQPAEDGSTSRASSVVSASTSEASIESPILQQQGLQAAPSIPLMHVHGAAMTHARIINRQSTLVRQATLPTLIHQATLAPPIPPPAPPPAPPPVLAPPPPAVALDPAPAVSEASSASSPAPPTTPPSAPPSAPPTAPPTVLVTVPAPAVSSAPPSPPLSPVPEESTSDESGPSQKNQESHDSQESQKGQGTQDTQDAQDTQESPEPASEPAAQNPTSPTMPANSPTTRRNCRFHKVSLPQEDTDRRFYFAVPGCSLNHELMKEEDIKDHGDVMSHDILDPDVEDLDPYVVGLLRQLVGVDLIRQREVFYMPQKGENYTQLNESINPRLSGIGTISARIGSSRGASRKKAKGPRRGGGASIAGSRSASVARSDYTAGRSTRGTPTSISDVEDSEEESKPRAKRARRAPSTAPSIASSSGKQAEQPAKRAGVRRSRRLQPDAHAYKPSAESEGESSEEEGQPKKVKGSGRRGRKRARTVDEPDHGANEGDVKKKRRVGKRDSSDVEEEQNKDS